MPSTQSQSTGDDAAQNFARAAPQGKGRLDAVFDSSEKDADETIGITIVRMVCESSGRNASERRGGLVRWKVWRLSPLPEGEDSMANRKLAETIGHSSGVRATARGQGDVEQLEKPSSSHREINGARYAV